MKQLSATMPREDFGPCAVQIQLRVNALADTFFT
jgi:hypothetical protein